MDIEAIKKLIRNTRADHKALVDRAVIAERYYKNENDITKRPLKNQDANPMRNADNRIPRNFHALLVNQKAAYMLSDPPLFDTGNREVNKKIADILGDGYAKNCKDLCIRAANCSVAWVHYWVKEGSGFKYAVMDSKQITPIYTDSLENELVAVLRNYVSRNEKGEKVIIWEYWTDEECYSHVQEKGGTEFFSIKQNYIYNGLDGGAEFTNVYKHGFGEVPFIPFNNNNVQTNDLENIKPLIDAYDKVFSGFLNDLEDIQEVILVLTNYGGESLSEFLSSVKKYKTIKVDAEDDEEKSGIETLNIEIPVEARKEFLEITRRAIFEQGQGVDPNPDKFGNTSGEALKFLYSLLELKSGFTETEFRLGFGGLIRAICRYLNFSCGQITQTWTRTAVTNDKELAAISRDSVGIVSNRTIIKYHPLVTNADDEEKQIKKEQEEEEPDSYDPFSKKEKKGGAVVDDR